MPDPHGECYYWDRGRLARRSAVGAPRLLGSSFESFVRAPAHCGRDARGPSKRVEHSSLDSPSLVSESLLCLTRHCRGKQSIREAAFYSTGRRSSKLHSLPGDVRTQGGSE